MSSIFAAMRAKNPLRIEMDEVYQQYSSSTNSTVQGSLQSQIDSMTFDEPAIITNEDDLDLELEDLFHVDDDEINNEYRKKMEEHILEAGDEVLFPKEGPRDSINQHSLSHLSYSSSFKTREDKFVYDFPAKLNCSFENHSLANYANPKFANHILSSSHVSEFVKSHAGVPIDVKKVIDFLNLKLTHVTSKTPILYFEETETSSYGMPNFTSLDGLESLLGITLYRAELIEYAPFDENTKRKTIIQTKLYYFHRNPLDSDTDERITKYLSDTNQKVNNKPVKVPLSKLWWESENKIRVGTVKWDTTRKFGFVASRIDERLRGAIYNGDYFNLWCGFPLYNKADFVDEETKDYGNKVMQTYLRHLSQVCNHNKQHMRHHISWIARVLNEPGVLTEQAAAYCGDMGTGKSLLLQLHVALAGPHGFMVPKGSKCLTDKFYQTNFHRKILVGSDEFRTKTSDEMDQFKNFITNPELTKEKKYQQPESGFNTANYILTFNPPFDNIMIDPGQSNRRFHFIESNPEYLMTDRKGQDTIYTEQFKDIIDIIKDKHQTALKVIDYFYRKIYKYQLFNYQQGYAPPSVAMDKQLDTRLDSFECFMKESILQESFDFDPLRVKDFSWEQQHISGDILYTKKYTSYMKSNPFNRTMKMIPQSEFISRFNFYQKENQQIDHNNLFEIKQLQSIQEFKRLFISSNRLTTNYFENQKSTKKVILPLTNRQIKQIQRKRSNIERTKQKSKKARIDNNNKIDKNQRNLNQFCINMNNSD